MEKINQNIHGKALEEYVTKVQTDYMSKVAELQFNSSFFLFSIINMILEINKC